MARTWNTRAKIWFREEPLIPDMIMLKKYANVVYRDGDVGKDPWFSNNILIFRLSDIMLLRAEALYKTGKEGDARTLVNTIRHRARLDDADPAHTGEAFFKDLVYERQKELYAEGHAFWDLLRTNFIGDFNPAFEEATIPGADFYGRNYWPIPRVLFKDNLLMKQTPYWNGRL